MKSFFVGVFFAIAIGQSCSASSHTMKNTSLLGENFKTTLSTISNTQSVQTKNQSIFRSLLSFPRRRPFLTICGIGSIVGCVLFAWFCYKMYTSMTYRSASDEIVFPKDLKKNLKKNLKNNNLNKENQNEEDEKTPEN